MNGLVYKMSVAVVLVFAYSIQASELTNGPKGINSVATGLDGFATQIGQVEPGRAGKFGYDNAVNCCNDKVVPNEVYTRAGQAGQNVGVDNEHALWVASVMISKQDFLGPTGGQSKPLGVAQEALLESVAFQVDQQINIQQEDAAIAAQVIATEPLLNQTNMSFGLPNDTQILDGSNTLTAFVDWSTVSHEVLYVVAGTEVGPIGPVPTDNFNGITVAASATSDDGDGVFRKVAVNNVYNEAVDAFGPRTSTLILAPGYLVDVTGPNHVQPVQQIGTSFAAPHVTGTLALLQQQANTTNGKRHLTKKAVILNSADKIKDIIGMDRTVQTSNKGRWPINHDPAIPVDREMGVGHLNAKRAVEQLAAGEHAGGGVPKGWDYAIADDPFIPNIYTLSLNAGDYVSATLVWDRDVFLNSPFPDYERGDEFIDFGFANLDLYLVPAGLGADQAVASSISTAWNLEHIFASVPDTGNYELWVTLGEMNPIPYAIAWWAGADERGKPGDFDKSGTVDSADYIVWRKSDGSNEGYNEWRANFGTVYSGSGTGSTSVPEPSSAMLLVVASILLGAAKRSRQDNSLTSSSMSG